MHLALRSDTPECEYESRHPRAGSRRSKLLMAAVALTSASALAITPVLATPTQPEVQDSATAVGLSAVDSWQQVFANSAALLNERDTTSSAAFTALSATLSTPAVRAQFTEMSNSLADPQRLVTALASFQGDYGDRLSASSAASTETLQAALAELPTVLQSVTRNVANFEFLDAWSALNIWLLVPLLGDGRAGLLDAFRIPGDFLDSIGLEPLARILGTSWMATPNASGQLVGPGLLSRTMLGNFGRAMMAPQVTTIIQIAEILDATRAAVVNGDWAAAANELMSAPTRIVNAFLNGYVPKFIEDGEALPGYESQRFPGIFSENGTVDFFFRQVPQEISTALNFPRPTPVDAEGDEDESPTMQAANAVPLSNTFVTVTVGDGAAAASPAQAAESTGSADPSKPAKVVSSDTQDEDGHSETRDAGVSAKEVAGTAASDAKVTTEADADDATDATATDDAADSDGDIAAGLAAENSTQNTTTPRGTAAADDNATENSTAAEKPSRLKKNTTPQNTRNVVRNGAGVNDVRDGLRKAVTGRLDVSSKESSTSAGDSKPNDTKQTDSGSDSGSDSRSGAE